MGLTHSPFCSGGRSTGGMLDAPGNLPILCGSLMFYFVWLTAANASSIPSQRSTTVMCPLISMFEDHVAGAPQAKPTPPWWALPGVPATASLEIVLEPRLSALVCPNRSNPDQVTKKKRKAKPADKHMALKLLLFGTVVIVLTTLF
ncbi:hypothetical protein H310_00621 [Aphanomyces invadans]|uniref:Uncharacterized protein n=1 Tax=Aphanomyces invadans TaxID=157072 RepID=A0A024UX72_9STRA|nr:hypothetical protein H310_00621 [Aphanomyces invadans]ETW10278.1 hypothetical protein H310_00621 [Aphanomyces invadans]|eukprot:XP_008861689.1 hypothetical protein H310_00621 [Aphanomyces invadans]